MYEAMTQAALTAYQQADRRDAALMLTFRRAAWTRRGWLMLLSGLAGFNRNVQA